MNLMKKKELAATILCFSVAVIWGLGYVFIPMALNCNLAPSLINVIRFGGAMLFYGAIFWKKIKIDKSSVFYGSLSGICLFGAFILLTMAQQYTTPSKTAFLQSLCTILIPFLSWIFIKRKPSPFIFLSVALYFAGIYLLCGGEEKTNFNVGDLMALSSAMCFAFQFIVVSKGLKKTDNFSINLVQFAVSALLFSVYYALFESAAYNDVRINWTEALLPLAGLTLLNTLYAYGVQTYAQIYLIDYKISLITSTENIWAVLVSVSLGFEQLRLNTILGGAIILLAILSAETLPKFINHLKYKKR